MFVTKVGGSWISAWPTGRMRLLLIADVATVCKERNTAELLTVVFCPTFRCTLSADMSSARVAFASPLSCTCACF